MRVSAPETFAEAVALLKAKGLLPTSLTAEQLNQLAADIRERAFFSARVTDAEFLSQAHSLVERVVSPEGLAAGQYMDKARFREIMKDYLAEIGYAPAEGTAGGLQDLSSNARLNLIADMNVQSAQGFGQFIQANDPAVLDAFPAQELFRLEGRKEPRNWPAIWRGRETTASGKLVNGTIWRGRMIALKDDPIWTDISRFGQPYPPFDYNSGMWIRPVSRQDAVAAGLIDWKAQVKRQTRALNDDVQSSVGSMPRGLAQRLVSQHADKFEIVDNALRMITAAKAVQGGV